MVPLTFYFPFFLDPQLKSLGSLVSVTLPSSSVLYTRQGSIIAVNSEKIPTDNFDLSRSVADSSSSSPTSSFDVSYFSHTFPFVSTKIVPTRPTTLLLSSTAAPSINSINTSYSNKFAVPSAHSVIISPTAEQDWVIPNKDSILAWTGQPDSSSSSTTIAGSLPESVFSLHKKHKSIRVHGLFDDSLTHLNPQVAVSMPGPASNSDPVLTVKLNEGECIYVHPGSVLAYTIPKGQEDVEETEMIQHNPLILPTNPQTATTNSPDSSDSSFHVLETQQSWWKSSFNRVLNSLPSFLHSFANTARAEVFKWAANDDNLLLKVSGPKTVLISSSFRPATAFDPPVPTQNGLKELASFALQQQKESPKNIAEN